VDVSAEVLEEVLGRAERLFGVDVPTFFSQSFEQQAKVGRISQGSGLAWEDEFVLVEGLLEKVEELTAEDDAERFDTDIYITSGVPFKGNPSFAHYTVSKGAVITLTRVLARSIGKDGICVNAVAPGLTRSESLAEARGKLLDEDDEL